MRVLDLQQMLGDFTDKLKGKGNAISDAKIYVAKDGNLEEIRRIEVHENNVFSKKGIGLRLVMKTQNEKRLILPPGMMKDY